MFSQCSFGKKALVSGFLVVMGLALVGQAQPRRRSVGGGKPAVARKTGIPAATQAALDRISADSMRGHLAFLASDLLEGRNTPSKGLDIAAEYLASQMMRAGLQPAVEESGRQSYFQTARWQVAEPSLENFELVVTVGGESLRLQPRQVSFQTEQAYDVRNLPLFKLDVNDAAALAALKPEDVAGKAVIIELPEMPREDRARMMEVFRTRNQLAARIGGLKPGLLLTISRTPEGRGFGAGRLIDPERPERAGAQGGGMRPDAVLTVHDPRLAALFDGMRSGETRGQLGFRLDAPQRRPVELKNVIGILPGSDPVLRDTYVIVSAHYDHVGIGQPVGGDRIYNGANDDASGTVSVIELATALATLKVRPKRTLVFVAWFGEEKGLLGSRYYGRHPVFRWRGRWRWSTWSRSVGPTAARGRRSTMRR
jgi:hypothetical protein